MTETKKITITKENFMYQIPPDELLYEWFREAQTSETKKFTVTMYDDGGYATNAYDVIFRVVEWCNSRKELNEMTETKKITITKENFMYQIPPDELLYEWFREAQTSETKKFTVTMYDDGGYATNAYDVIFRVVEWCNSRKELK